MKQKKEWKMHKYMQVEQIDTFQLDTFKQQMD